MNIISRLEDVTPGLYIAECRQVAEGDKIRDKGGAGAENKQFRLRNTCQKGRQIYYCRKILAKKY